MTWDVAPLKGKYYGTKVVNTTTGETITVWLEFDAWTKDSVSVREISEGWEDEHGFDHVESARSYRVANIIADALSREGL